MRGFLFAYPKSLCEQQQKPRPQTKEMPPTMAKNLPAAPVSRRPSTRTLIQNAILDTTVPSGERAVLKQLLALLPINQRYPKGTSPWVLARSSKDGLDESLAGRLFSEAYIYAARFALRPENQHVRHLWQDILQTTFLHILEDSKTEHRRKEWHTDIRKRAGHAEMRSIQDIVQHTAPFSLPRTRSFKPLLNHMARVAWWWDDDAPEPSHFPETVAGDELDPCYMEPNALRALFHPTSWETILYKERAGRTQGESGRRKDRTFVDEGPETTWLPLWARTQALATVLKAVGYPEMNRFGAVMLRFLHNDEDSMPLAELGQLMGGLTSERARQTEVAALAGLRMLFVSPEEPLNPKVLARRIAEWKHAERRSLFAPLPATSESLLLALAKSFPNTERTPMGLNDLCTATHPKTSTSSRKRARNTAPRNATMDTIEPDFTHATESNFEQRLERARTAAEQAQHEVVLQAEQTRKKQEEATALMNEYTALAASVENAKARDDQRFEEACARARQAAHAALRAIDPGRLVADAIAQVTAHERWEIRRPENWEETLKKVGSQAVQAWHAEQAPAKVPSVANRKTPSETLFPAWNSQHPSLPGMENSVSVLALESWSSQPTLKGKTPFNATKKKAPRG